MPDDVWRRPSVAPSIAMPPLNSTEHLIAEARMGRMFVLIDDEDRENEGDLIIPAQFASAEVINFMAKHGRGLICLALTQQRVRELGLPMMVSHNGSSFSTNFTVSIEARYGVTTGISAHDRAHTIATAINYETTAADIATPGHMFPLVAKPHGVLERAGHTEASVDIARLAGLLPAAVICEIISDDGTMMRGQDLIRFCEVHGLSIGTIADLIAYRERHETLIQKVYETQISHEIGGIWDLHIFSEICSGQEHVALSKGSACKFTKASVHVHQLNPMDTFLPPRSDSAVANSMRTISDTGEGLLILIRQTLQNSLLNYFNPKAGSKPPHTISKLQLTYQILGDIGVTDRE